MAPILISDILGIINKKYPFSLAEDWDNVGLQVGSPSDVVTRILVALEPTDSVITEALSQGCQLLITHHPLIFKPLKRITTTTATGAALTKAIRGNLSLIALHTNYDAAPDGLNSVLASTLGLTNIRPLRPSSPIEAIKLSVLIPQEHLEAVRNGLLPYGRIIDTYASCSFTTSGEGTFKPLEGSRPAIGSVGKLSYVAESKLEIIIEESRLNAALTAIRELHPYESPAFEYTRITVGEPQGSMGLLAEINSPLPLSELGALTATKLKAPMTRYCGNSETLIRKIALCSGSGASLINAARHAGADVLITGDIKYHEAHHALESGLCLIDAGHFHTEIVMVDAITTFLSSTFQQRGMTVEILPARTCVNPFQSVTSNSETYEGTLP